MLNQATMDMLTAMKMTAMTAEFTNQLKDPTFNELGFEEQLGLLVNAEWNRRQSNKPNRFIRNAHFAVPSVTVEGIEYHEDRKLDKAQMLRFAICQYIDEGHHIILKGPRATARLTLPAPWAMRPAAVSRRCSISICWNCWMS